MFTFFIISCFTPRLVTQFARTIRSIHLIGLISVAVYWRTLSLPSSLLHSAVNYRNWSSKLISGHDSPADPRWCASCLKCHPRMSANSRFAFERVARISNALERVVRLWNGLNPSNRQISWMFCKTPAAWFRWSNRLLPELFGILPLIFSLRTIPRAFKLKETKIMQINDFFLLKKMCMWFEKSSKGSNWSSTRCITGTNKTGES